MVLLEAVPLGVHKESLAVSITARGAMSSSSSSSSSVSLARCSR
jgi:hypothetical protein